MVAATFTRPVFRSLASTRPAPGALRPLAPMVHDAGLTPNEITLADAFDVGFAYLAREYRCEYYFKAQIVSKIIFGRHSPRTASALLEVPMGLAIADVMVVNGTTSIYEIKTDLDNFDRLSNQLSEYRTRAEFTHVVVSEKRTEKALASTPEWAGLIALRPNGALSTVRKAKSQLHNLVPEHQFQLLRTDEARRAVQEETDRLVSLPAGAAYRVLLKEFAAFSPAQTNAAAVRQLRLRGKGAGEMASRCSFPASLRPLAYAEPLSPTGAARLLACLGATFDTVL